MKKDKYIKLRRVLIIILLLLVFAALPLTIVTVYKSFSQDEITVDANVENITVYTGGDLSIIRNVSCTVQDGTDGITSMYLSVPSNSISALKSLSDNIAKLTIIRDITSDYISIDFSRAYGPSESFTYSIAYTLAGQYTVDITENQCSYNYISGGFSGANVKSSEVYWNAYCATHGNPDRVENGKLVWNKNPDREDIEVKVIYPLGTFNSSVYLSAISSYAQEAVIPYNIAAICVGVILCATAAVIVIIKVRRKRLYIAGAGFNFELE